MSEQVRVESAPPPSPIARAAAAAKLADDDDPDEAVTATIRVRFPEQEPETAKVPIDQPEDDELDAGGEPTEDNPSPEARSSSTGEAVIPAPLGVRDPGRRRPSLVPWLLVLGAALLVFGLMSIGVFDRLAPFAQPGATDLTATPGTIAVVVDPPDSQIFLYVGRGPAVAQDLTLSGPHEFVVFDRGLEPSRAVVPSGARWSATKDGALYELAVQARPVDPSTGSLSLGNPLTEPAPEGTDNGAVRVITNPPGAKVYRFVGHGPTVEISAPSIHEGQELLVYHPERSARREVIGPSDWRPSQGQVGYKASVEVALPAAPSSTATNAVEN